MINKVRSKLPYKLSHHSLGFLVSYIPLVQVVNQWGLQPSLPYCLYPLEWSYLDAFKNQFNFRWLSLKDALSLASHKPIGAKDAVANQTTSQPFLDCKIEKWPLCCSNDSQQLHASTLKTSTTISKHFDQNTISKGKT